MNPDEVIIESLRRWSHVLLWVSIVLPALGALAAGARFYVERHEKRVSAQITATAVRSARDAAEASQRELAELKEKSAPRRIATAQREALLPVLRRLNGRPVAVACRMMDGESCDFAMDLAGVLRQAGCAVPDLIKTSLNDLPGYLALVAHGEVAADVLQTIDAALKAAQIPARVEPVQPNSVGMWYQNAAHIIVGRKSPS
jgi:hypothetical protein